MRRSSILGGTHGCSDSSREELGRYHRWEFAGFIFNGPVLTLDQFYGKYRQYVKITVYLCMCQIKNLDAGQWASRVLRSLLMLIGGNVHLSSSEPQTRCSLNYKKKCNTGRLFKRRVFVISTSMFYVEDSNLKYKCTFQNL